MLPAREEDLDDSMKRQRGDGGGGGPYGFNPEWDLGGNAPDAFGGSNGPRDKPELEEEEEEEESLEMDDVQAMLAAADAATIETEEQAINTTDNSNDVYISNNSTCGQIDISIDEDEIRFR